MSEKEYHAGNLKLNQVQKTWRGFLLKLTSEKPNGYYLRVTTIVK